MTNTTDTQTITYCTECDAELNWEEQGWVHPDDMVTDHVAVTDTQTVPFDKDQPFQAEFTDKDVTRGTWTMGFKNWTDFNSYVAQKVQIIESYQLSQN